MSPTRELAGQLFEVLKSVGKHHGFSAGLLIGGRRDVDAEKEHVNALNILVCTPGRLLQHMDETPNFDCSQLQVQLTTLSPSSPKVLLPCLDLDKRQGVHTLHHQELFFELLLY